MDIMYSSLAPISTANPSDHLPDLKNHNELLNDLVPIFPPPNFEVPDIAFSNSVSPNADFNQSLFSSAHLYNSAALFMKSNSHSHQTMNDRQCGAGHSPPVGLRLDMAVVNQQQEPCCPQTSSSPLGSSSSDDNDDVPCAQLTTTQSENPATGGSGKSNSCAESANLTPAGGSHTLGSATRKAKSGKRKKRKDPNEPQKPVSAYALFFRDSQASIKGHNPSASFGEVSKIVASMWDQLNPEHKEVYKKKTEMAKKQYLKQLAAYRASQVSQLGSEDVKKAPLSPNYKSRPNSAEDMTGPMMLPQSSLSPGHAVQMPSHLQQHHFHHQQQQQQPPQQQLPHHHHHFHQHHHRHQLQHASSTQTPPGALPRQPLCTAQQHSPLPGSGYKYPPHADPGSGQVRGYQGSLGGQGGFDPSDTGQDAGRTFRDSMNNVCYRYTQRHPSWDTEYCQNESVLPQCRDSFSNWSSSAPSTNTFPVK